ncbi:MAG TPA: alpha/beta hydrolase [Byssovorax sp.]|jgi:pimeloyl-ACP methyl ester carboxylesterase
MPVARTKSGVELTYEERGRGEPLVLISGIGMQLVSWPDGLLDALAARGLRVIVFDNRDVGCSTKLTSAGVPPVRRLLARAFVGLPVTAPYTLFDMADDVAGLLDHLGIEQAHVAGTSLGGMVAQAFAASHPRRARTLASLMSFSGGRRMPGKPSATLKLVRRPPRTRDEAVEWQLDFFRTAGSTGFYRDERALALRAARAFDRGLSPAGFARQFAAVLATGDMRPRLAAVTAPTLVLHGSVDPIFRPECAEDTARAIPGATKRIVHGWGHDLAEGVWDVIVPQIADHALAHRIEAERGVDETRA